MSAHHPENPGDDGAREAMPVPRDMPDQQAGADEDRWEPDGYSTRPAEDERSDPEIPDPEIPDTDEAGTGRRGSPHSGSPRPEHPVPDEPSD